MKRIACLLGLFACSSSTPPNVAGDYSVQVTNGSNGCMFASFTVGSNAMNIPVTITQDGANVTATVTGVVGDYLNLALGSDSFAGTASGSTIDGTLTGQQPHTMGNCAFTYNAQLSADVDGDNLRGEIDYTAQTNNGSDCGALNGCTTVQEFAGSRPPQ